MKLLVSVTANTGDAVFAIEYGVQPARAALFHLRGSIEVEHAFLVGGGDHLFDAGRGCSRACFREEG